jgi:hypothetical protein
VIFRVAKRTLIFTCTSGLPVFARSHIAPTDFVMPMYTLFSKLALRVQKEIAIINHHRA